MKKLLILVVFVVLAGCARNAPPMPQRGVITPGATYGAPTRPPWTGFYENLDYKPDAPMANVNLYKVGAQYMWHWGELEPQDQQFDWQWPDTWFYDANRFDYYINFGVIAHAQPKGVPNAPNDEMILPPWMLDSNDEGVYYLTCNGHRVPYYWSSNYITQYKQLATEVAGHLKNDTQGQYVDLFTLPFANYAEIDPSQDTDWECIKAQIERDDTAGALGHIFSGAGNSGSYVKHTYCPKDTSKPTGANCTPYQAAVFWGDLFKYYINIYRTAWNNNSLGVYIYGNVADNAFHSESRKIVANHLISLGYGIAHNKLQADEQNWLDTKWGTGEYDAFLRGQEQVYAFGEAIDSYQMYVDTDPQQYNVQEQVYHALYNAIDKHMDVLKVNFFIHPNGANQAGAYNAEYRIPYNNPQIATAMRDFINLAGHNAQTTPYTLVFMRETQNTAGYMPQCGNFDFYLYMTMCPSNTPNQSMSGKCQTPPAVPANFDGCPRVQYNVLGNDCPGGRGEWSETCDPRWRTARVTDSANPRMYFDVDDLYASGAQTPYALVTIEYVDVGTDAIAVEYINTSGQRVKLTKTKGNTRQWVSWTFQLSNMRASNELATGTDFIIYDNGDGVEYVNKVTFTKANAATPTPTRNTPTPQATLTPRATNTPVPTIIPYAGDFTAYNTAWQDTYMNSEAPASNYGQAQALTLRAATAGTPQATQYPTTRQSGLVYAALPWPTSAAVQSAQLKLYLYGYSGDKMYVYPRAVSRAWTESGSTWRDYDFAQPWQTPGAYGANDVGPRGTPVAISASDVNNWISFDVKLATTYGRASIKLEPVCTPAPSGSCSGMAYFYAANAGGDYIPVLSAQGQTVITPTPTPTWTATPTRNVTATPTAANTPGPTPTATPVQPTPTPTPNPTQFAGSALIKINEVCANPVARWDNWPDGQINARDRAVEIVNLGTMPVNLSRYALFAGNEIRLSGELRGRGYKVFHHGVDKIDISPWGGSIALIDYGVTPYRIIDSFDYFGQAEDACWARLTDGNPTWVERGLPTLGWGNNIWSVTPTPTARP